eukprot:3667548-Rhodomonas_salina.1
MAVCCTAGPRTRASTSASSSAPRTRSRRGTDDGDGAMTGPVPAAHHLPQDGAPKGLRHPGPRTHLPPRDVRAD